MKFFSEWKGRKVDTCVLNHQKLILKINKNLIWKIKEKKSKEISRTKRKDGNTLNLSGDNLQLTVNSRPRFCCTHYSIYKKIK